MDKHAIQFVVLGVIAVLAILRYLIPWVYDLVKRLLK